MSFSPLDIAVYVGLVGVVIALFVATAQNKWQPRVFALLALRLAVGWHFCFEGLHKVHSQWVTKTETSTPFSSTGYFNIGNGPLADHMRREYVGDPVKTYTERLAKKDGVSREAFANLNAQEQAELCPRPVADLLGGSAERARQDELRKALAGMPDKTEKDKEEREKVSGLFKVLEYDAEKLGVPKAAKDRVAQLAKVLGELPDATDQDKTYRAVVGGLIEAVEKNTVKERVPQLKKQLSEAGPLDKTASDIANRLIAGALLDDVERDAAGLTTDLAKLPAKYAAWVYGTAPRPAKFKDLSTPTDATPDQWREYIDLLEKEIAARTSRTAFALGHGDGVEAKRTSDLRADLTAARKGLADATDEFIDELKKEAGATNAEKYLDELAKQQGVGETNKAERDRRILPKAALPTKPIDLIDRMTAWGVTAIGVGLLAGLFTRVWCVAGIGFLVMTYLTAPPWPWLPPPPPSEGNPLFINKNLIEAVALLVILVHPTGRWLGVDALIDFGWHKLFGKKTPPAAPPPAAGWGSTTQA